MRVLLDENMPRKPVALFEIGVVVRTIAQCGWKGTMNETLLRLAEADFEIFVTMDQGILHEQNLSDFDLEFILMEACSNRYEDLAPLMLQVNRDVKTVKAGELVKVIIGVRGQNNWGQSKIKFWRRKQTDIIPNFYNDVGQVQQKY